MHPDCGGKGCEGCTDGFFDVQLAEGPWFHIVCNQCGNGVGMTTVPREDLSNCACPDPHCDGDFGFRLEAAGEPEMEEP